MPSTLDTLVARTKLEASVNADDPPFTANSDEFLKMIVTEAVAIHNSAYSVTSVPDKEVMLVVIIAWIHITNVRLGRIAQDPTLSGASGYGQDRDTPFYKLTQLLATLQEMYDSLAAALGLPTGKDLASITVSSLVVEDDLQGGTVPISASNVPSPIVLTETGRNQAAGTIDLKWTMEYYPNWKATYTGYLLHATESIRQEWNYNSQSGFPQMHNDANVMTLPKPGLKERAQRIEGIEWGAPGTKHRLMILVEGLGGQWGYSNELIAITV